MSEPGAVNPTEGEAWAAFISALKQEYDPKLEVAREVYIDHEGHAGATVQTLVTAHGWTREFAEAVVPLLHDAGLAGLTAERSVALTAREAAFFEELAERLLKEGSKIVGEALAGEGLDALARRHGLTLGADGHAALAEDAAPPEG
jgi:hypothetical protein